MPRGAIPARFRPAAWALADQCVVSAANFLTVFIFARYLSATAFGEFAVAQTALLLLTSLQGALLAQPHNVLGAGLPDARYQRFTAALNENHRTPRGLSHEFRRVYMEFANGSRLHVLHCSTYFLVPPSSVIHSPILRLGVRN